MSEKILNGDFLNGTWQYTIDDWNNGVNEYQYQWSAPPGSSYYVYCGYAGFVADPNREFDMNQEFSSNDEVISAKLALRAKWNVPEGEIEDGYLRYLVEIEKPDTSRATILNEIKPTNSDFGGPIEYPDEGWLLLNEDVAAHFDQYGTHKIWIRTFLHGASEGLYRSASYTVIISVSLNMVVKKYKSVHEKMGSIGSSDPHQSRQSNTASDIVAISEDYSMKVEKPVNEIIGLVESYSTEVRPCQFTSASEAIGLVEGMTRVLKPAPTAESMSFVERIQATRTQGNVITIYDISDLMDWDEITGVTTPWIKEKTEIN